MEDLFLMDISLSPVQLFLKYIEVWPNSASPERKPLKISRSNGYGGIPISCWMGRCLGIWVDQGNITIWPPWHPFLLFHLADTKHLLCVLGLMDLNYLWTLRKSSSKSRMMTYWLWDSTVLLVCGIINNPNIYWLWTTCIYDNCLILSLS